MAHFTRRHSLKLMTSDGRCGQSRPQKVLRRPTLLTHSVIPEAENRTGLSLSSLQPKSTADKRSERSGARLKLIFSTTWKNCRINREQRKLQTLLKFFSGTEKFHMCQADSNVESFYLSKKHPTALSCVFSFFL